MLMAQRVRVGLMIDLLNELASGTPSDQSAAKVDVLEELGRLRASLAEIEGEIGKENERLGKG